MIRFQGHIYRKAASVPSWKEIWFDVQNSKAFETEFEHTLTKNLDIDEEDLLEELEEEYYGYYGEIVEALGSLEGQDCWRALTLPPTTDPTELNQLGIYWAFSREEAFPHWDYLQEETPKHRRLCVYQGRVALSLVNWKETVLANVSPATREGGTELRFFPGELIYVHSVTLADGTVLPIEDYRRC